MTIGKDMGREILNISSTENLNLLLECPVCREIPLPPIYQCTAGHIICSFCRDKLTKCCLCKGKFIDARNLVMESIVDSVKFRCDYYDSGCCKRILGSVFKKHLKECNYRSITCYFGCNDQALVKYSEFLEHMKRIHQTLPYASPNGYLVGNFQLTLSSEAKTRWSSYLLQYDGQSFLTRVFKSGPIVYFSMAIVGNEEDASAYAVKINMDSVQEESTDLVGQTKFAATIPVNSIRKTNDDLLFGNTLPMFVMTEVALKKVGKTSTINNDLILTWKTNFRVIKTAPITSAKSGRRCSLSTQKETKEDASVELKSVIFCFLAFFAIIVLSYRILC